MNEGALRKMGVHSEIEGPREIQGVLSERSTVKNVRA